MWYGPPTIPYPQCEAWNDAVISKLQKDPPNLVILSMSRWIFTGNTARRTSPPSRPLIRMIDKIRPARAS